jgi:hypothetical protein
LITRPTKEKKKATTNINIIKNLEEKKINNKKTEKI